MEVPLFSTVTLFTEIIVSVGILYVFYSGYFKNRFPFRIAFLALTYELAVNVTYMAYRAVSHEVSEPAHTHHPFEIALAVFHGIFSLVMFVALIVFIVLAWLNYRRRINYFKKHKVITVAFLVLWMIAVLSGVLFYFTAYILQI
ncbi:hypothetical protein J4475_04080 [Candidatus Woesearchaeota archaeon]|nr:hypothetical protein [Candidatus Woesearchaeota archaeon]